MAKLIDVIVSVFSRNVDKPFTYIVPSNLRNETLFGKFVIVPFGSRKKVKGIVVAEREGSLLPKLKEVLAVIEGGPVYSLELVNLSHWLSKYYLCRRIDALQAMLPFPEETREKKILFTTLSVNAEEVEAKIENLIKRAPRQAEALKYILKERIVSASQLCKNTGVNYNTLKSLEKKGIIKIDEKHSLRTPKNYCQEREEPFLELNLEQNNIYKKVIDSFVKGEKKEPFLIHGVTGSGKTEIYLHLIKWMLTKDLSTIVLLPEISLTSMMVERFRLRFGHEIAILHSKLSQGERYDEWWRVCQGKAKIVLGARSAVFAPVKNLGLIIMDEEHEGTFKQEETPRYHTREVANWRADYHNGILVLGSATPSVETYFKAESNQYRISQVNNRIADLPMPKTEIVDMREEIKKGNRKMFSKKLQLELEETLSRGEQAIILLNRRGHSTFVLCRECGHVMKCPHCNISLTYHSQINILLCHYCFYKEDNPRLCPKCKGPYIKFFGTGTQRVENEITSIFEKARVVRMDADTTSKKDAHWEIIEKFKNGNNNILLGTQMIAKGFDFPKVTLVGVISADLGLNLPDFRAGERSFQLLTQVSGRAGRSKLGGKVVIQSYFPDHYAVVAASNHDYKSFYRQEIEQRKELCYPPFSNLIRLIISGKDEREVIESAERLKIEAQDFNKSEKVQIMGPVPCPLDKVKDTFRWHFIFKGDSLDELRALVVELLIKGKKNKNIAIVPDVEPLSML